MANTAAELIRVRIEEGEAGLLYATSPDLLGFLAAAPDREALLKEIPAVIKAIFKVKGIDVEVLPTKRRASAGASPEPWPWVAIPAHLAAQSLQG